MAKANKTVPATTSPATGTAMTVVDASNYALISNPGALDAIRYNLRDERISEFDLDRVKVPAAGGTAFQVPGLEGIKNHDSVEGIVLHVGIRRAYWESLDVDNSPPDCFSIDGINGSGNPGGDCASCPFNQFGSAIKQDGSQGAGKRCRERRIILFLRSDDRLPLVIVAPPTSIKGVKQFLMRLPVPMYQAVVRISLERVEAKPAYSRLVTTYLGQIDYQQGKRLEKYAETLRRAIIAQAPLAAESRHEDDTTDDPNMIDAIKDPEIPDDEPSDAQ